MFFDPNTNFVENEKGQQKGMPRPMQNQFQVKPQTFPNQQQNFQQKQQPLQQNQAQPSQQNAQNPISSGPQLNERIARIRQEQMMEEQQDYKIIQERIDQILEKDPKKLEEQKELEYQEKLKKNPFIKQKYTLSLDNDNLRMLILFNTKQNPSYKLQHYMYFTNQAKANFQIGSYNKFHFQKGEPNLKFYLKFSDKEPDYVLVRRSKLLKNYSLLSTDSIENENQKTIQTIPYRGFYSNQYDYQFFKMQMQSEKNNFTD
ncbi:hypothetical protein ABPG72_001136 [Tetrahymena utriculariae]